MGVIDKENKDPSKNHGAAFYDINRDYDPIYKNFSLLSYISPIYAPRVIRRLYDEDKPSRFIE